MCTVRRYVNQGRGWWNEAGICLPRGEGVVNFPACGNLSPIQETNKQQQKTTAKPRTFQRRMQGGLLPGESKEQGCYNVVPEVVTMTTDDRQKP